MTPRHRLNSFERATRSRRYGCCCVLRSETSLADSPPAYSGACGENCASKRGSGGSKVFASRLILPGDR